MIHDALVRGIVNHFPITGLYKFLRQVAQRSTVGMQKLMCPLQKFEFILKLADNKLHEVSGSSSKNLNVISFQCISKLARHG